MSHCRGLPLSSGEKEERERERERERGERKRGGEEGGREEAREGEGARERGRARERRSEGESESEGEGEPGGERERESEALRGTPDTSTKICELGSLVLLVQGLASRPWRERINTLGVRRKTWCIACIAVLSCLGVDPHLHR